MATWIFRALIAGALTMPLSITAALAAPGNAEAGREKADAERCNECHGAQGQGDGHTNPEVRFPKLAGQQAAYVFAQLQRYRNGQRKHEVMKLNTRDLSDDDLHDLAAFYAALPPMRAQPARGDIGAADTLFAQGDAARGVIACITCHGPGGRGLMPAQPQIPRLAGQDPHYLELQLQDWRSAWRTEPAGGVMNQVARKLTDTEIKALAIYLASQSP